MKRDGEGREEVYDGNSEGEESARGEVTNNRFSIWRKFFDNNQEDMESDV